MLTPLASEAGAPGYRISIEPYPRRVKVVFAGIPLADSERAWVLRETRYAPVVYFPKADVRMDLLAPTAYRTHCPFKGDARYWAIVVGDRRAENAVWAYEEPVGEAARIAGHLAFQRSRVDEWIEAGEPVPEAPAAAPHADANPLVDWLMREAWRAPSVDGLVLHLGRKLASIGMPISRLSLIVRTLHPQVMGTIHLWERGRNAVDRVDLSHARSREERFLASPFVHIFEGRGGVRRRLELEARRLQRLSEEEGEQGEADGRHDEVLGPDHHAGAHDGQDGHEHRHDRRPRAHHPSSPSAPAKSQLSSRSGRARARRAASARVA